MALVFACVRTELEILKGRLYQSAEKYRLV